MTLSKNQLLGKEGATGTKRPRAGLVTPAVGSPRGGFAEPRVGFICFYFYVSSGCRRTPGSELRLGQNRVFLGQAHVIMAALQPAATGT